MNGATNGNGSGVYARGSEAPVADSKVAGARLTIHKSKKTAIDVF